MTEKNPLVSIVIPSFDGYRDGLLPKLLTSLKEQTFQDVEVLVIKGDYRGGRAINNGVKKSKGGIIIIMDDDTILAQKEVLENLVTTLKNDSTIGMAGVSNLIPKDAPWLIRRAMYEIPRGSSPLVKEIVDSDIAATACCAIPKKVYLEVGGESELIPRGLDPHLRHKIRQAGYRVVVIPNTWIHHLLPNSLWKILKQHFKNGKISAYCNKFYPELVYDLSTTHTNKFVKKPGWTYRILRYIGRLLSALFLFKWIWFSVEISNLLGFIWGYITVKKVICRGNKKQERPL